MIHQKQKAGCFNFPSYWPVLLFLIVLFLTLSGCGKEGDIFLETPENEIVVTKKEEDNQLIIVEIKGEVIKPGVFTMEVNSRLNDLLLAAGGATPNASLRYVNLALRLLDGDSFYIPHEDEETAILNNPGETQDQGGKIDLNKATKEDLMSVPGIGPSTAENILNYRSEAGKFNAVDDLLNVDRIGEKTLEKIREYFIVR